MTGPLICFYGDDLTGSTDALAAFRRCGLSARLYLRAADASAARDVQVVGIAGTARSLPAEQLAAELRPAFDALASLGPAAVQYKICSTFDSSARVGSIGRACEIAAEVWGPGPIPVLAAQPDLGRWTIFGQHFARAGDGRVYRLDRHPTMSVHPVTPSADADLALVLAGQTSRLAVRALHRHELASYAAVAAAFRGPIVLDALDNDDLLRIGELVWPPDRAQTLVSVGSGGLSLALGSAASRRAMTRAAAPARRPGPAGPPSAVLALSGSCSAETARQIAAAVSAGWLAADVLGLGPQAAASAAVAAIGSGRSAVLYTAVGRRSARAPADAAAVLAEAATGVFRAAAVSRLLVAGGDTSGTVVRALDGQALEYLADIAPGAALCALQSASPQLDGVEVVLKGGQVGDAGFFEQVRLAEGY